MGVTWTWNKCRMDVGMTFDMRVVRWKLTRV